MKAYKAAFGSAPGSWSPYTYDSVNLLAYGVEQAGGFDAGRLAAALDTVDGWTGWTGPVTIDPAHGNRDPATVVLLDVDRKGAFRIDPSWAEAVGVTL